MVIAVDIASVSSALGALKDIYNGIKTLQSVQEDLRLAEQKAALLDMVNSAQLLLYEVQEKNAAASGRINELEAALQQAKSWEEQKQRYQLHRLATGAFVYRLQPAYQLLEPEHDLCTHCYQQGIPSILQYAGYAGGHKTSSCPNCRTVFLLESISGCVDFF